MKIYRLLTLILLAVALAGLLAAAPMSAALADDPTPTDTPTPTSTPTETATPTATITTVPGASIIWAGGQVTLSEALLDAIAVLLEADPPEGAEGVIYTTTHVSGVDTNWNISISNLVDVAPPYEEWNMEENAGWSWFVQCEGTEPTWTCDYYELPPGGGGGGFRFPWSTGFKMQFGMFGVHEGANMIPGSIAVDFVGSDVGGANVASDTVIAAADGVITSICDDGTSMAIRVDGGPVPIAYFHFQSGQPFYETQEISKGEVLGVLRHGEFHSDLIPCNAGWADQMPTSYHIHFVFTETSPGFLEIGGCVLNLSSEQFVCDGNTYPIYAWLPNGGGSSDPDPDPIPTGGGGAHIWDGIVAMIVELNQNIAGDILPEQEPTVPYLIQKLELVVQALLSFFAVIYSVGLTGEFFFFIVIGILGCELTLLETKIGFWIGRLLF